MASKDYLKLCEEAQKKKLKLMKKQEKQIKEIYNDMYLKVSKKISTIRHPPFDSCQSSAGWRRSPFPKASDAW